MARLRARARDLAVRHVGPSAVVLLYHRVARLDRDPQLLAVDPDAFDEHLAMLAADHSVVPLGSLAGSRRSGRAPKRTVVITFDDGYVDDLTQAAPLLSEHGLPATFFVCSGLADSSERFWWDELAVMVLAPGTLPSRIELEAGGARFFAELQEMTLYTAAQSEHDQRWSMVDPSANERQVLYRQLCDFIRPLSIADRRTAMASLRATVRQADGPNEHDRHLTPDEIVRLDAQPGLSVGGHTSHHVLLAAQDHEAQRREILEDRRRLEDICGRPIEAFSYPFGALGDYTEESVSLAKAAGYAVACANHPGLVKPWTDPCRLPRHLVRDWSAETLAARLEDWFDGGL